MPVHGDPSPVICATERRSGSILNWEPGGAVTIGKSQRRFSPCNLRVRFLTASQRGQTVGTYRLVSKRGRVENQRGQTVETYGWVYKRSKQESQGG